MAEVHFVDGSLKAHTDFGEFNDDGVWIPKEYDGSYGTYGFYLEFKQTGTSENSSGMLIQVIMMNTLQLLILPQQM